jgi:hypothetical protein
MMDVANITTVVPAGHFFGFSISKALIDKKAL